VCIACVYVCVSQYYLCMRMHMHVSVFVVRSIRFFACSTCVNHDLTNVLVYAYIHIHTHTYIAQAYTCMHIQFLTAYGGTISCMPKNSESEQHFSISSITNNLDGPFSTAKCSAVLPPSLMVLHQFLTAYGGQKKGTKMMMHTCIYTCT
jgi:hypothetical protein